MHGTSRIDWRIQIFKTRLYLERIIPTKEASKTTYIPGFTTNIVQTIVKKKNSKIKTIYFNYSFIDEIARVSARPEHIDKWFFRSIELRSILTTEDVLLCTLHNNYLKKTSINIWYFSYAACHCQLCAICWLSNVQQKIAVSHSTKARVIFWNEFKIRDKKHYCCYIYQHWVNDLFWIVKLGDHCTDMQKIKINKRNWDKTTYPNPFVYKIQYIQ